MTEFKNLSAEQVAAYLEGKGKISDLDFLNEMIQDPVLDAVVGIYNDINDDIMESEDINEINGVGDTNDLR